MIVYTESEIALITKMVPVRLRADSGDRRAQAKMAALERQVAVLERKGKRGDAAAARKALVLRESGLLTSSQTFDMRGAVAP
jgi:hypothetical protein